MSISIKSEEDIKALRVSGERLAQVVNTISSMVVPGISIQEIDKKAEALIREYGDIPAFLGYKPWGAEREYPSTVCISVNEEVVHGIPTEDPRIIQEKDIVSLDCGVIHKGLITDHAVSVVAGEVDTQTKRLLDATHEGLMTGIKAAKGGARVGDISAAIEEVGVRYGYGIVHALGGHGVGHEVHEEPYIANFGTTGTGPKLIPGMVLAIEPMFTEGSDDVDLLPDGYTYVTSDRSRSAHFEHTILITENEAEILTIIPE